jgi:putative methionine-R-sulfoxide reductase with GAF domain
MVNTVEVVDEIRRALGGPGGRSARFERAAEIIRAAGDYRWVGIYDVASDEITVVAWSGPGEPAHPRFPVSQGLCGDAARRGETVVVGDVTKDPRYLTTFGSTRSEIVVPIRGRRDGRVRGTLDVESEETDAFGAEDRAFLERCAEELAENL